jgi:hypothetical protein
MSAVYETGEHADLQGCAPDARHAATALEVVSEVSVGAGEVPPRRVRRKPTPIEQRSESHRRRMARQGGFGLRDLDPVTRERLQVWSFAMAGWELIDAAADPERWTRTANVVGRALTALERRLREVGLDGGKPPNGADALAAHVKATYGERGTA